MPPIDIILIGAGNRGREVYGAWAAHHPDALRVVGVADPDPYRREAAARQHRLSPDQTFASWEELLARPQLARAAIITTQDSLHTPPTLAALKAGYEVLLEKPMAPRLDQCVALVQAGEAAGRMLQICHVLRYTSFFAQVREVLHSGRLGQAITVSLRENVSAWHIAHSFVRGSWRRADLSSPMILAKCCHDLDILGWLLDRRVTRLSSVGGLTHFRPENAPEGAPTRCTDGCPAAETCPYYAPAIYLDLEPIKRGLTHARNPLFRAAAKLSLSNPAAFNALAVLIPILRRLRDYDGHPRSVISDDPTNPAALLEALKTGPYGRCVYHCDNDVVDHQVVLMEYEGGLSATLTMHGHSEEEGRTIRIDGSQASLFGKFGWGDTYLEIRDHRGGRIERFNYPNALEGGAGHGDADDNLMRAFADALHGDPDAVKSNARDSLEGHLLAFAAEEARLNRSVIEMDAFRARADSLGAAYVL